VAKFIYLETSQNCIHEDVKGRLNSGIQGMITVVQFGMFCLPISCL